MSEDPSYPDHFETNLAEPMGPPRPQGPPSSRPPVDMPGMPRMPEEPMVGSIRGPPPGSMRGRPPPPEPEMGMPGPPPPSFRPPPDMPSERAPGRVEIESMHGGPSELPPPREMPPPLPDMPEMRPYVDPRGMEPAPRGSGIIGVPPVPEAIPAERFSSSGPPPEPRSAPRVTPYQPAQSTFRICRWIAILLLVVLVLLSLSMFTVSIWNDNFIYRVDPDAKETVSSKVRHGVLDNGVRYYILNNNYKVGRFTSYLRVDVGSLNKEDDERGIAHFAEHLGFDNGLGEAFHGRGKGWDEAMKNGAANFNAFTTFRTTSFQLWDMPANNATVKAAMSLHREQTMLMAPLQANMDLEKGAVLGEARFRNSTGRIAHNAVLMNHGGNTWRIPDRFAIGIPEQVKGFKERDVNQFLDNWYRAPNLTVMVVGNISVDETEKAVKEFMGALPVRRPNAAEKGPARVPDGKPKPLQPIFTQELRGINGVQFHLLATRDYIPHPHTYNTRRQHLLDKIMSTTFTFQASVRFAEQYPETVLQDFEGRDAGIKIENEYSLGVLAHVLSVTSPGNPFSGTWKKDLDIGLTELRRMAEHGVPKTLLERLTDTIRDELEDDSLYSGHQDSRDLIDDLLGDLDPNFVWMDPEQRAKVDSQFLDDNFIEAAQVYIQSEAQFLYKAVVELLGKPLKDPPYDSIETPTASLTVFHGVSLTEREGADAQITDKDILPIIQQVYESDPPAPIEVDKVLLSMLRGMEIDGMELTGAAPAVEIPASGALYDRKVLFERLGGQHFNLTDKNSDEGILQYKLANGIRVNVKVNDFGKAVKNTAGGSNKNPQGPEGSVSMQIVSLGGRAAEPADLQGVCKFINLQYASGYNAIHYTDNGDITGWTEFDSSTTRAYFGGRPAKLECGEEFMIIQTKLHGACPNYPSVNEDHCDPSTHAYFKKLEGARLAMSPYFDSRTTKLAAAKFADDLQDLETLSDPEAYVDYHVRSALFKKAYPDDTRLHRVTSEQIKALDPLRTAKWVREQFTSDRIEINVVGDVAPTHLLAQLNLFFGTLPNATDSRLADKNNQTITREGYDFYSDAAANEAAYQRKFPTSEQAFECEIPNAAPGRSFHHMLAPADDFLGIGNERYALDPMVKHHLFNAFRRDSGYSYYVSVRPHHSVLFDRWGYYSIAFCSGDYPPPPNTNPLNATANTETALVSKVNAEVLKLAKETLTKLIPENEFDLKMNQVSNELEVKLQSPATWFVIMRGAGLLPPKSWPSKQRTGRIKSLANMNIKGAVDSVRYKDIAGHMKALIDDVKAPEIFANGVLVTAASDKENTCKSLEANPTR